MPHPASGCSVLPFANPAHSKNCWHPRLPNGLTLPAPPLRSRKHSERRERIEGAEVLAKKSLPFRLTFLSHNSPNADKPLLPVFLSQTVLTDTLAAGGAVHEPPVARVQCGMEPRAPAIGIEDKDIAGTHGNAAPHAVPGLGLRIGHAGPTRSARSSRTLWAWCLRDGNAHRSGSARSERPGRRGKRYHTAHRNRVRKYMSYRSRRAATLDKANRQAP